MLLLWVTILPACQPEPAPCPGTVVRAIYQDYSGPLPDRHTERYTITPEGVRFERTGDEGGPINRGVWAVEVAPGSVQALFDTLGAVDCRQIAPIAPESPEIGGNELLYQIEYEDGRTFDLWYREGYRYTNGHLITDPLREFVRAIQLPPEAFDLFLPLDVEPPTGSLPSILTGAPLPSPLAEISPESVERLVALALWPTSDEVSQIAYSPDGRTLAVATYSGVKLLDAQTGQRLAAWPTPAWSVAFSPDGALLASGWEGGQLQLWPTDPADNDEGASRPIQTLAGHTAAVHGLAWSPDGQTLASVADDGAVILWDVTDCAPGNEAATCGRLRSRLAAEGFAAVRGVVWSPDGALVAAGMQEGTVRLWPADNGALRYRLDGGAAVVSLAAAPADAGELDEFLLAAGLSDGSVSLWRIGAAVGPPIKLAGHSGNVMSLAFSPDGALLASGGDWLDDSVQVWRLSHEPTLLRRFHQLGGDVLSLAFRPDGRVLAAAVNHPVSGIQLWGVHGE